MVKTKISVILPVLNEGEFIGSALQHLKGLAPDEVIVVDGGSRDDTCQNTVASYPSIRLLKAERPNRAYQMNLGARAAHGDVLLFLHADMRLASGSLSYIRSMIGQGFVGGGFEKKYRPNSFWLSIYGFLLNKLYLGVSKSLVGTNAIFVRKSIFESLGGFLEQPILEDVEFSRRLKSVGPLAVIKEAVEVSSRRYMDYGVLRQIMLNALILMRYCNSPKDLDRLTQVYRK